MYDTGIPYKIKLRTLPGPVLVRLLVFALLLLSGSLLRPAHVLADTVFCHEKSELSSEMELYRLGSEFHTGRSSQGMCVAGSYIIYTRFTSDFAPTTYIVIDSKTRKEVGKYSFNTLHSNSLTWNPDREELVCVSKKHAFVFSFRDHRMNLVRDIVMSHNCCKIAYVSSLKTYYLGTSDTIYRSNDFQKLKPVFHVPKMAVDQGMGFDGNNLYIIWYTFGHNTIAVYSPEGVFQRSYSIVSSIFREVEEVDFLNDKMIISVANSKEQNGLYTVSGKHIFSNWETFKQATCSKDGIKIRTCRQCRWTEMKTIPATGVHRLDKWITIKKPSCEKKGKKVRKCLDCGQAIETESIPAKGHRFSYWKTITEPDVMTKGFQIRHCERCDKAEVMDMACLPAYVRIYPDSLSLSAGSSYEEIRVHLNKGDRIVSWTSANPDIAGVSETGKVTAHRPGETRITVQTAGGGRAGVQIKVGFFSYIAEKLLKLGEK